MTFLTTPFMRSFVGFDNLFDELERVSTNKENSYPAYNIEKTGENSYEICIALAGFDESQISVDIAQGVLMISASNNSKDESRNYLHKGIATRAFSKQFRLAETVEVEKANFHNGMLNICLFRKIPEAEKPKNIKINSAPRSKVSSIA